MWRSCVQYSESQKKKKRRHNWKGIWPQITRNICNYVHKPLSAWAGQECTQYHEPLVVWLWKRYFAFLNPALLIYKNDNLIKLFLRSVNLQSNKFSPLLLKSELLYPLASNPKAKSRFLGNCQMLKKKKSPMDLFLTFSTAIPFIKIKVKQAEGWEQEGILNL